MLWMVFLIFVISWGTTALVLMYCAGKGRRPTPRQLEKFKTKEEAHKARERAWYHLVKAAMLDVENSLLKHRPDFWQTLCLGCPWSSPNGAELYCFFNTSAELREALASGFSEHITIAVKEALVRHGYPSKDASLQKVSFKSKEESNGSLWPYLA